MIRTPCCRAWAVAASLLCVGCLAADGADGDRASTDGDQTDADADAEDRARDDHSDDSAAVEQSPACEEIHTSFAQCGLIDIGTRFYCPDTEGEYDLCISRCWMSADCRDVRAAYCGLETSETVATCVSTCGELHAVSCGDGTTVPDALLCDGRANCESGVDEMDCPVMVCDDGTQVVTHARCNGSVECPDGSDEDGCSDALPTFDEVIDCTEP